MEKSVQDNILLPYNFFKLPIEYVDNIELSPHIVNDLEMLTTLSDTNQPIYKILFNNKTTLGDSCLHIWSKKITTNQLFLEESQELYKSLKSFSYDKNVIKNMLLSFKDIRSDNNFIDKYQYIDIEKLKWANKSTIFLQILSYYNISSPVINLITPLSILLIPFLILKLLKLPINFESYKDILFKQLKKNSFGQLFFEFNNISIYQKVYCFMCIGLYIYNIYQNIISCYKFYKNTHYILTHFDRINDYLDYTIQKLTYFSNLIQHYKSYESFKSDIDQNKLELERLHKSIRTIKNNCSIGTKIKDIGYIMKHFYLLYDSEKIHDILQYSFGFHGYIDNILGIFEMYEKNKINTIRFSKSNKTRVQFKNAYHPCIKNNIVKNNINLKKNHIITGPNAAGKTTLLKSTIINLILSQQIGMGFYSKGVVSLFDYIHCYINIPDSCSRDSLFQAEARRCKNILDIIKSNPKKKHFCIFDELYSGTNPYEAVSSAFSYLNYISSRYSNVKFMITTHYVKLCELLKDKKVNNIVNKHMNTDIINDIPIYKYKLKNGISTIKGGVSVLRQLQYPEHIIALTKTILNNI